MESAMRNYLIKDDFSKGTLDTDAFNHRKAVNVSICGFIELIILNCRAPWRLNRDNRCQQIASFEYPYVELLDVVGRHFSWESIRHIDSPRHLGMFRIARDHI